MTWFARTPNARFLLADRRGELVRAFGQLNAFNEHGGEALSYAGGASFWVAAAYEQEGKYQLEEWDTAGRLLRTIERSADWLPRENKGALIVRKRDASAASVPAELWLRVHADSSGLLLVLARVAHAGWFDLIEPDAGLLLSSGVFDSAAPVPWGIFRRVRGGYRLQIDSTRLPRLEILEYSIEPARSNPG